MSVTLDTSPSEMSGRCHTEEHSVHVGSAGHVSHSERSPLDAFAPREQPYTQPRNTIVLGIVKQPTHYSSMPLEEHSSRASLSSSLDFGVNSVEAHGRGHAVNFRG